MAGYTRQSTFTDGDVITAAHSNDEFNQILAVFNNTTGHKHDGTAAEGPVIGLIGDPGVATPLNKVVIDNPNNQIEFSVDVSSSSVEQLVIKDGVIEPTTTNDIDLGSSSKEFKDAFFDGTVTADALVADTADINAGSIDGATLGTNSAITQAVIDNVNIDGATIGHTSDTDLMTLASGVLTVAGEVSMTTLDIGGTDITATGAELNLMDGGTTAGTTAVAGGDGIVTNDDGTMRQTTVDTFDTYLAATSKTLTNKTIDADNNTLSNIEVDNLKSGVLDTDLSSVAGTDTTLASAKAIKAYVDAQIQTEDTLVELNDTDISSEAAGHILIHDGSDSFDNKPISGDITLAASGAVTIANSAVETAMLNPNVISGQTAITSGLDTTNDTVLVHDADAGALKKLSLSNLSSGLGGLSDIVSDTSPQLGGDLDVNGNGIVSVSDGNITLTPNGSGVVRVDGTNGIDMESGAISIKNSGAESYVRFYCESSNAHYTQLQAAPHSAYSGNVTVVLPASADTLVGRATTDTLTNKSIDASQLTGTVANARLDAQLQDIAGLATTDSGFIVGDGSNFVLETGATVRTSLGLGTAAVTNTGTSAGNTVVLDGSARLPSVDGSQLTNLPSTGATAGFAVAMAIAL
tara:strand:+ start:4494 stop:6398 length:1905 start_codon:yes stop_codon:yes gene_type:complete